MTGIHDHNRPGFDEAAKRLREQGHFVINPAELSAKFGSEEEVAIAFEVQNHLVSMSHKRLRVAVMDADLAAVRSCDAIYLLRGWETSRGAKRELAEAIAHGLTIMQEGDDAANAALEAEKGGVA
jgi:hypothetical protein